jgi:putative DNA primase/helicase
MPCGISGGASITETHKEAARRFAAPMIAKGFEPQALHAYTDANGEPLYWRIRLKHPFTGEKWIRPMKLSGRGFELGEPEFPGGKPLYARHRLADDTTAVVWIFEGEQKADAINKLGLVGTTSGSATSAAATDWQPLAGRRCIIWPDNDDPGKAYAGEVASVVLGMGCEVSCIEVEKVGLGVGEDVIQWLAAHPGAAGGDIEALPIVGARPTQDNAAAGEYARTVELIRGSDVNPEAVCWLWGGWLAAGKMHILGGAPGTGKTTISLALMATVTMGGCWPDGTRSPIGNVAMWSGEDDPADTLIPRLILAGANLSRVYFITAVKDRNERRSFDPAIDMDPLQRKLAEIGDVRLLIIDPIVSAIAGDSHKNAEVRRGLQPLVDLAASMRCALLGITHFSKGTGGRDPVERLTGSLAFGALARVVFVAAKHQEEGEGGRTVRLLLRAKSNIGPDDGGFEYDLQQGELKTHPGIFASSAQWGAAVKGTARELLGSAETMSEAGGGDSVVGVAKWLRSLVTEEDGHIDRRDVMKAAHAMGHKERTVHRAREKLGLIVEQRGFGIHKRSVWTWPTPPISASIVPIVPNKLPGTHGMNGGTDEDTSNVEVEI